MIFPSPSVAPSIYTDFVNGVKFDICEVDSSAYDMLYSKRSRFFLSIEDTFIYNYKGAEDFFNATGETRWDLFTMTKADCLDKISKFSELSEQIASHIDLVNRKPVFAKSRSVIIEKLKNRMLDCYGVHP